MNKSKMFFTALAMVVLTGCSTTNHLRHEVVDQLWCSPQVVEYFPAGGVDLENVVAQYYMASASQGRLALVSTNITPSYATTWVQPEGRTTGFQIRKHHLRAKQFWFENARCTKFKDLHPRI